MAKRHYFKNATQAVTLLMANPGTPVNYHINLRSVNAAHNVYDAGIASIDHDTLTLTLISKKQGKAWLKNAAQIAKLVQAEDMAKIDALCLKDAMFNLCWREYLLTTY